MTYKIARVVIRSLLAMDAGNTKHDPKTGQFASNPGGTTQYHFHSSDPTHPGFAKNKKEAFAHAKHLESLGHKGVKVMRATSFGGGAGTTRLSHHVTRTVHHGYPDKTHDAGTPEGARK